MIDYTPFLTSIRLASLTTCVLLVVTFPLAYLLSMKQFRLKPFFESLINLPLVLPPTVIGFYLLLLFSPRFFFGGLIEELFNIRLVFSFAGLVVASCIYSLPFMIQPLINGMEQFDKTYIDASYSLGKSKLETLFHVIIPNIIPNIITGMVMTFAHTMGEFGVVLMIGGNIPGDTKVASIAIYDRVEELDYKAAHQYALLLVAISFIILLIVHITKKRSNAVRRTV